MRTITTIAELMTEIESGNYNYYGLRGAFENDMNNLERGYLDCSHDWVDGEYTEEELSGTCAIGVNEYINEAEIMDRYNRALNAYSEIDTVLLIADKNQEYGNDENEVILGSNGCGADIIAIVRI